MNDKVERLVEWVATILSGIYGRSMEANKPQARVILSYPDLVLIDRDKDEKEWPNIQLIIEHLSDILTTAEEHHDSRGNSTQTLYRMDLDRIAQAIDILKSGFTHLYLADSIKEMK